MNELFRMNEYGDIWQEPTLFDQPSERDTMRKEPTAKDLLAELNAHERRDAETWARTQRVREDIASGEVWPEVNALGHPFDFTCQNCGVPTVLLDDGDLCYQCWGDLDDEG